MGVVTYFRNSGHEELNTSPETCETPKKVVTNNYLFTYATIRSPETRARYSSTATVVNVLILFHLPSDKVQLLFQ